MTPSPQDFAPPTLPDQPPTFRWLDPAAALAFRTPLQEHPPAADTKAAALLTAFGIMFAALARFGRTLDHELRSGSAEWWVVALLLAVFVVAAVGAIVQAFRTISPRFPQAPPSLAFFGDIAKLSREEYVARVESLTHEEALEQILAYNYTLATISAEKFLHLRIGLRLFRWSFAAWLPLTALLFWRSLS